MGLLLWTWVLQVSLLVPFLPQLRSLTTQLFREAKAAGTFGPGMVGLYLRFTSGTLSGQRRLITAFVSPTNLTVASFGAAPAANDTFVIEVPELAATAGGSTTTVVTTEAWTVNFYANSDVVFITGALAGQRRRIASNTATTLTLSAAVTGNTRTGALTGTPGTGDIFRIVPSSDFIYFHNGASALYRLDVAQTTGAAWSAALATNPAAGGGGANTVYAGQYDPFAIVMARGSGTNTVYRYGLGPNTWSTLTTFFGAEVINNGAAICLMHGKRKMFIQIQGSTRCVLLDLTTGLLEPGPYMPYANPSSIDGKRARFVRTSSGVEWVYILRAGGQEFYRVPVEWL